MEVDKRRRYRRLFVLYLPESYTQLSRRQDDELDTVTQIIAFKHILKQGRGTRGINYDPLQLCISAVPNPCESQLIVSAREKKTDVQARGNALLLSCSSY